MLQRLPGKPERPRKPEFNPDTAFMGGAATECPHCGYEDRPREFVTYAGSRAGLKRYDMQCDCCGGTWLRIEAD